jgi:hypothetical protein
LVLSCTTTLQPESIDMNKTARNFKHTSCAPNA